MFNLRNGILKEFTSAYSELYFDIDDAILITHV